MATPGNTLKVCNCNRTMSLDGAALGRALGRDAIPIYTELCRKEVDGFTSAMEGSSCTVACTQEAALFSELAESAGTSTELKFVNIREAAGWSTEGAAATAKIAALLAQADLPEPQPRRAITALSVIARAVMVEPDTLDEVVTRIAPQAEFDLTLALRSARRVLEQLQDAAARSR